MSAKNKAVFLDRDGTINEENGLIGDKKDFQFIPGVIEAIKLLNRNKYKVIIVTNQAGIAHGYHAESDVCKLHDWMIEQLQANGAYIDEIYYCPHHKDGKVEEYNKDCLCRKPGAKMIEQGIAGFNVDARNSYIVGDRVTDMMAGEKAGLKTILVLTGYTQNQDEKISDYVCPDLHTAVKSIILKGSAAN